MRQAQDVQYYFLTVCLQQNDIIARNAVFKAQDCQVTLNAICWIFTLDYLGLEHIIIMNTYRNTIS